ncbi:MAG: LTA synthase family protein [Gammaproteobacteria bacterium]|nr:LTA synthase family protein [Gammaproteobacteria bacterium]
MTIKTKLEDVVASSRYGIILLYLLINLAVFTCLRLFLLVKQFNDIDTPIAYLPVAFLLGILYDLAYFSYLLIPFVFYLLLIPNRIYHSRIHRIVIYGFFAIFLYLLFFIELSEWTFWDEFGTRFNFIAVDYLVYTHEVINNIVESYPLGWLLFAVLIITVISFYWVRKLLARTLSVQEPFSRRLKISIALLVLPVISFFAIPLSAYQFSSNSYLNEVAANGPYQFFSAFRNNELDYRHFYKLGDDRQLSALIRKIVGGENNAVQHSDQLADLYNIKHLVKAKGAERSLNVILITVESLSAEFLKTFGGKENITPFMDTWFSEGMLFTNFYAVGTRTIRGLEALTLSIPPTPGQSIVKRPGNDNLFSLGYVFQQHGYDTVFLYGGRGFFDNMNAFYSGNGYRIVDQTDFTPEELTFTNAWGVSDDIIYNRTLKEADRDYAQHKPFFFQIMTTSNHRPFTYPEGKIDIPSGKGRSGGVKYTDYAMQQFIGQAKSKPWFDDTLFVMVADHCAGSAHRTELPVDKYHIPLFMYAPKYLKPAKIDTLSSQIDVAPTILGLLNVSYESQFYGKDILQMAKNEGRALVSNYQRLGLFKHNTLSFLSPQRQINIYDDPMGKHTSVANDKAGELVQESMAYYQSADYIWTHRLNRHH